MPAVYFNFLFFWLLTTYAIANADIVGLLLSIAGFLLMHALIEENEEGVDK